MATKLQIYSALAEQIANEITAKRGNWTGFLDTEARLYKYSFPDQLMIHAQRPDATACASIELWNDSFSRWIRRGSNGIALIDDTGNYPRLKYVFDVSDTEPLKENAKPVYLWEMRQEHTSLVLESLAKVYDDIEDNFSDSIRNIAKQLAMEYYIDNAREIRNCCEDSFLEELDGYNFESAVVETLTASIAYTIMSRCGFDTADYFDEEDFEHIFNFNTPDMVYALGTAASELSQQVLRDIELVIKKYERTKTTERSVTNEQQPNLHTERGLSSSQSEISGVAPGQSDDRTIRSDEESISKRPSDDNLQLDATERNAVPAPDRSGGSGEFEVGTGDENSDREETVARQSDRSDGLDGGDEHVEVTGGGNGLERTDLRINETPSILETPVSDGVSSMLETYSQLGNISINESLSTGTRLSTSSITLDEVDSILRDGGNRHNSVLRITAYFSKGKTHEENTDFLRREYATGRLSHPGGKGFQFGAEQTSIWFDDTGITIGRGKSALHANDFTKITWEQAAARIGELMERGQYVSHDILDEAVDNEKEELAGRLWHFYRDDMEDIPEEWRGEKGGYPEDKAIIKSKLSDPDERQSILDRLEGDVVAWSTETGGRSWNDPQQLLSDMLDSTIPPKGFPIADIQSINFMRFITDDEVDSHLTRGSLFSEGKFRILSHFLHDHTPKERADFLKNEYGHGGGSWHGVDNGWTDAEPGKGISLKRGGISKPYDEVKLSWSVAASRINELIKNGRYMTRSELNRIPQYGKIILARQINNFYYNLPEEYKSPFPKELDFHYPKEEERTALNSFLADAERIDTVLGEMRYIYTNTPEEDRNYHFRKSGYESLSAYRDGTYTLFPKLEMLPEPELAETLKRDSVPQVSPPPASMEQMSLFDFAELPVLPSVEEQQTKIEQAIEHNAEPVTDLSDTQIAQITEQIAAPVAEFSSVEFEVDNLLLRISNENKARIAAVFANNPRSREAVNLVREIYGNLEDIIKSIPISWSALHKRVAELAKDRLFDVSEHDINISTSEVSALNEAIAEKIVEEEVSAVELDFNSIAAVALERVLQDVDYSEALNTAKSRAMLRNPCGWALEKSIRDHEHDESEVFNRYFSDEDFNDDLFNYVLRRSWENRTIPEVAAIQSEPESTQTETSPSETQAAQPQTEPPSSSPQPVFFVDWKESEGRSCPQSDFDLRRYNDGDTIGYNKDGVKYTIMRMGDLDFINSTSRITMWGDVLGDNNIPQNIRDQIRAYRNGELTDEQVRENYIEILNNVLEKESVQPQQSAPAHLSSYEQYLRAKERYPNHTALTTEGDFNELHGEDAQFAADAFGYILIPIDVNGEKIPFTGIPKHNTDTLIAQLNERGRDVVYVNSYGGMSVYPHDDLKFIKEQLQPIATSAVPQTLCTPKPAANFRITDDHLGEGGAKTKFNYNIEAIKTLRNIELESRAATPEEQQILSRYVGWGALQYAFDSDNKQWSNEYLELKSLLSKEEFESARASTLNAHYTSPTVIKAIYETVERLGFKTGNVLEPACGVGNFFGLLPESMKNSKLYGVELDGLTARIAKQLYPNANIKETGFEKTDTPDAFFDLAIGNVPLGVY